MGEETLYDLYTWSDRNDHHDVSQSHASSECEQKQTVKLDTDFISADWRMLQYHLFYSSKL